MALPSRTPSPHGLVSLRPLSQERKRAVLEGGPGGTIEPASRGLLARWERSRALGADPDGAHALEHALVGPDEVRAAHERIETLWRHARPILEDFAATCSRRDFVTLLSDPTGVVTHALGGGAFAHEARRLRLVEGATWGEDLRGTNAIGTALAEGRPIAVHGAAHFARVNEGLVCIAAPVRDPRGDVLAIVDATSWSANTDALDPSVVLTVARAIEEVLRAHAYARSSGGLQLVERLIERSSGAAFLVERPGRIVRANAEGRAHLERRGTTPALPGWDVLEAAAGHGRAVDLHLPGGEVARVQVEPVLWEDDGPHAVLVVLAEPARTRPPVPATPPTPGAFAQILGDDPALVAARDQCARLAGSDLPVVLLAETGTGKELFARAIHDASRRAAGPYVAVNCGAIQSELLLSELFGHGPGAFTGATRGGRDGIVAAADGGTIFLDEVADLSVDAQVALLRVLEDGSYTRVGETVARRADIRVVAATSRDLRARVAAGRFREDLFFRIGGACVELPPLRARRDFDTLLDALWARTRRPGDEPRRLAPSTRARLAAHAWPGNVRELETALEYAAVMAGDAPLVEVAHLPATVTQAPVALAHGAGSGSGSEPVASLGELDDARRQALLEALRVSEGNVSRAARRLGVARSTVYRLARRYGVVL